MGMVYELDDTEKSALAQMNPRPGERIQKSWCEGCKEWHEGSVLGGPIGDPHGDKGEGK